MGQYAFAVVTSEAGESSQKEEADTTWMGPRGAAVRLNQMGALGEFNRAHGAF